MKKFVFLLLFCSAISVTSVAYPYTGRNIMEGEKILAFGRQILNVVRQLPVVGAPAPEYESAAHKNMVACWKSLRGSSFDVLHSGRGAFAYAAAPDLFLNVGLTLPSGFKKEHLRALKDIYAENGNAFSLYVPKSQCLSMEKDLEETGFHNSMAVEGLELDLKAYSVSPCDTDRDIRIEKSTLEQWGVPIAEAFGFSPETSSFFKNLLEKSLGSPHWRHYTLYEGKLPVSSLSTFVHNGYAGLYNGGTCAAQRRRGHLGSLVDAALKDAQGAGVRGVIALANPNSASLLKRKSFKPTTHYGFYY